MQLRVSIKFHSCSYSERIIVPSYLSRKQLLPHYLALPSLITSYYPTMSSLCNNRRLENAAGECFSQDMTNNQFKLLMISYSLLDFCIAELEHKCYVSDISIIHQKGI
jgi:hypothetical protein